MIVDKQCTQQVLGCLMKHPQYLSEVDKYCFVLTDFPSRFEKYIFTAIQGLYFNGATTITAVDIENYLSSDSVAKKTFEVQNGVEYLQDIEDFTNEDNFPYYYNKLKKLNLLKDLKKQGMDISDFYIEDLTSIEAQEVNSKFESLSIPDIIGTIKKKLLKLETTYAKSDEVQVENFADTIDDFLEELNESCDIGLPVQGKIYNHVIGGAVKGTLTIRSGSSGLGKALPNSTVIPTPIGWRRVDEIKQGDYLFDAFGKPTKVLNIYPQGIKEVYQVTFKDGRVAKCCDEHLWSYNTCSQKENAKKQRKFYTKTLKEISKETLQNKDGTYRILVPMQMAVEYKEKNHYLSPYVMGLLLGDGSFRQHPSNKSLQFSSEDEELPESIGKVMGWFVKKGSINNYNWYFSTKKKQDAPHEKINVWVEDALKEQPELINTDSKTKFIPREYIEDSIENRYELLRGLLDSDGRVDNKGRISYFTISEQLRDGVIEIARSLGFKTHVTIDSHKETNIGYIVSIQGKPEDKIKLFKLKRKKDIIENWYNSTTRFEKNTHNPIVKIEKLDYSEEMTCFYVDNDEHLFLTEDFIVTHNTRSAVGDACLLAYPIRYNSVTCKWEQVGSCEKVLFIITEQSFKEVKKMILAYLTDINEARFKYKDFTDREQEVINQAIEVIKRFRDNFIIVKIPDPNIELVKAMVRENCLLNDIGYVFYDYVFISPSLLNEFRGFNLRNDEVLLLMTTALKDLAVELNVALFTATQVNANADNSKEIRNEASLAGGRATINKADNGAIMARPTKEELDILKPIIENYGVPNVVTDIFKVRSGEWTQVRIWSIADLGRMKREDLFITDSRLDAIDGFFDAKDYEIFSWTTEEEIAIGKFVKELNNELSRNN